MQNGFLKFFQCCFLLSFLLTSCLKNNEDPVPEFKVNDYVGQWKGTFPYKTTNAPASELRMSLITYSENSVLTGFISTPYGILILDNTAFFGGVYSFSVRNNSFDNPQCQSWDVNGSAYLMNASNLGLSFGGTFCSVHPDEITGTMTKASDYPDSSIFLTYAAVGRELVYEVTESEGASFTLRSTIQKDLKNGVWRIQLTRSGVKLPSETSYQFITPVEWGELPEHDSMPAHQAVNYRIDAKVGVKYIKANCCDSIIITIKSLGETITVPAGTYKCVKMVREYKSVASEGSSAYYETWFNNNVGIVKNLQYVGDSLVMTEVLKEKNF